MSAVRPIEELVGPAARNGSAPAGGTEPREPRIRFYTPGELRAYEPRPDEVLVGKGHIMRGEVAVLGGPPAAGKSIAATNLAHAGAIAQPWFGLQIPRPFKTLVIQTENGRYRLKQEYSALPARDSQTIESMIRVSEPPPYGLALNHPDFQADLTAALGEFRPDLVVLDPWNAAARDDKQRDYVETFDAIRRLLPTGADRPALLVVAHTRKPKPEEKRTGGTGMMHLLSGSYVLTSVPRCVFILVRASDDEDDDGVVFFNPKTSNGPQLRRSAWRRDGFIYRPSPDFDWSGFDARAAGRKTITEAHLKEVLKGGPLPRQEVVEKLAAMAGVGTGAAYNALKGRLAVLIRDQGGKICLK